MKKMFLAAVCMATALAGCATLSSVPSSPSVVANKTVLDEQGMLAVELAYSAARIAVETGVDAGVIKGQAALRFATLDNKAFLAVAAVRQAYKAGNATSYSAALKEGRAAVTDLLALTGKAPS